MASLTIPAQDRTLTEPADIQEYLGTHGIWYRRFEDGESLGAEATSSEVLASYDAPIQLLMKEGGYVTADVINIGPETPGIDEMLNKFNKEHWHAEDEVRFVVKGSGLFHIRPVEGEVFRIEMIKGDMINVPRGTHHWFDLCGSKTIQAIRLFQDPAGWAPNYTQKGTEEGFEPLCLGPEYIERQPVRGTEI